MMDSRTVNKESTSNHNFTVAARIKPVEPQEEHFKVVLNKNRKELHIETHKQLYNSKAKNFSLNSIFPEDTSNESIFDELVRDKLDILKKNCNISLMAYGATNSGKTYTIFGSKDDEQPFSNKNEGLAYLCADYLINSLFKGNYKFYFSYLQIYNQNVQDLLGQQTDKKHYLNIFQDCNGKINIPDLTKIEVESYEHLCGLIQRGNDIRVETSNFFNQRSSRSHALLQLEIFSVQDPDLPLESPPIDVTFMVIDLAGSQKCSPYYQEAQQLMKEGASINKSLLALGNCITNLSNGQTHIPYRDSKLTRILKDNLSGYCHNIMIACVSQQLTQFDETINTLQYASKAYKIETTAFSSLKNRSQYVRIPCEHCHMAIDFNYLSGFLKHYNYALVDLLLKEGNYLQESASKSRLTKGTSKKKKKNCSSLSKTRQTTFGVDFKSTKQKQAKQRSLDKDFVALKLNLRSNQSKSNKSLQRGLAKQQKVRGQLSKFNLCLNLQKLPKEKTSGSSNPSFLKYSSINSKKEDISMISHQNMSVLPFTFEEQSDLSQLYSYNSKPIYIKEQLGDDCAPLKMNMFKSKRNSQPKHSNPMDKENDLSSVNMQNNQEGSKTARQDNNEHYSANNNINWLPSKAATRMKPDTLIELEPIRQNQSSIVDKQRRSRQKIRIIPKIR